MLTALRNTALAAITAPVASTAVAGAARADILVDGFINIAAVEILHVQFVTAARYDTYDAKKFLLDTTNIPGVVVTDFNYALVSTTKCHIGTLLVAGPSECVRIWHLAGSREFNASLALE